MKFCSKCGTKCFDSDKHCPRCGTFLKDPKTHNKMTFEKFMKTPQYMGCIAMGIIVVSAGLCLGSAFAKNHALLMSIVALIFAMAGVFIASHSRREMEEGTGMRAVATAAYALGIVTIISCIAASACNSCYALTGEFAQSLGLGSAWTCAGSDSGIILFK